MKQKTSLNMLLLGITLFFFLGTPAEASVNLANDVNVTEEQPETALDLVNDQLDHMNFSDIEQYWNQIVDDYGGFLPELQKESVVDYIKQAGEFSFKELSIGALKFIFHELLINGKLIGTLILLTILSMFLQSLQNSFEKTTVSKIAYSIVFMVLIIIALNSFHSAIQYASGAIQNMIRFYSCFYPVIISFDRNEWRYNISRIFSSRYYFLNKYKRFVCRNHSIATLIFICITEYC